MKNEQKGQEGQKDRRNEGREKRRTGRNEGRKDEKGVIMISTPSSKLVWSAGN